jgi:hypothetical protein
MKRRHSYPVGSEVQHKAGHVYVKDRDGKWHPRGRVTFARFLKRELKENEKVFHINGNPSADHPENLVAITFSAWRYRIAHSKPVFIPSTHKTVAFPRGKAKEPARAGD